MKVCLYMIHKHSLSITTHHMTSYDTKLCHFFFVVLAQLLTTLVWIECDGPDGSYFLEWWGHIFGFCAKSHIITSFLSEPVSPFTLIGCIAFQFFFWVIIDGLFSPPWIFSIDLPFYLPHPCFIIHTLLTAYYKISLLYNFSFFLGLFILIGC